MVDDPGSELAGAAFDLANAGYAAMPDPRKEPEEQAIGSDGTSLRQAADQVSSAPDPIVARGYLDANGEPAPQNEAITLARAARDYADITAAERLVAENESAKTLAERVDALRAEAAANDPDAADFYGFELPEDGEAPGKPVDEASKSGNSAEARADPSSLDPELEKALADLAVAALPALPGDSRAVGKDAECPSEESVERDVRRHAGIELPVGCAGRRLTGNRPHRCASASLFRSCPWLSWAAPKHE
jgi:hypothetical protein